MLVSGAAPDSGCVGTDADGAPLLLLHSRAAQCASVLRLPPPGAPSARIEVRSMAWIRPACGPVGWALHVASVRWPCMHSHTALHLVPEPAGRFAITRPAANGRQAPAQVDNAPVLRPYGAALLLCTAQTAQLALQVAFAVEASAAAAVAATRAPPPALTAQAPAAPHANPAALPPHDFLLLQPSGRLVPALLLVCCSLQLK